MKIEGEGLSVGTTFTAFALAFVFFAALFRIPQIAERPATKLLPKFEGLPFLDKQFFDFVHAGAKVVLI
ncbi:MAG TPA: hypothetical protein DIW47_05975 [Bacteroidetes bacterium]|nr:hypothetical protein [Bacteroidota bacterium]